MSGRAPPAVTVCCLAGALLAAPGAVAVAAEPPLLFAADEVLELTLQVPMRDLLGRPASPVDAVVRWGAVDLPARVETFGRSRKRECAVPPLAIRIEPEVAAGTPFAGASILRLVTHCRHDPALAHGLLKEYLAYRAYGLVAEPDLPALRTRLARVRYRNTRGRRGVERHGFFVEDIGDAARRLGLDWAGFAAQRRSDLDPRRATVYALFQYMVGNTDWSILSGPEGEACCHNSAVLVDPADGSRYLLPYDFDQSGLVDAPYAVPSAKLGIRNVRQRVYRGFCDHNGELPAAVEVLRRRRGEIEALFLSAALPDRGGRREAWRYLSGFFDLIDDPERFRAAVVARCRPPGE